MTSHDASYAIADQGDGNSALTLNMRMGSDWPLPQEEIDVLIDSSIQVLVDALKAKAEQPA